MKHLVTAQACFSSVYITTWDSHCRDTTHHDPLAMSVQVDVHVAGQLREYCTGCNDSLSREMIKESKQSTKV